MKKGEIWWANLPAPIGHRPVLLLSRDEAYKSRTQVTIAELTTTVYHIPVEVPLGPHDGVPRQCVVNLDTLNTVPKESLLERVCELVPEKMKQVHKAIKFALDLP
jgi:mRNA interferase MazF